jgi:hypothetical protein
MASLGPGLPEEETVALRIGKVLKLQKENGFPQLHNKQLRKALTSSGTGEINIYHRFFGTFCIIVM